MEFRFRIYRNPEFSDKVSLYLWAYDGANSYSCQIKEGLLELSPKEDGEAGEPFLTSGIDTSPVLRALTEGLKDAGYVAEVDNAQRLTSEAVAKERKDEIDWLRGEVSKLLEKV